MGLCLFINTCWADKKMTQLFLWYNLRSTNQFNTLTDSQTCRFGSSEDKLWQKYLKYWHIVPIKNQFCHLQTGFKQQLGLKRMNVFLFFFPPVEKVTGAGDTAAYWIKMRREEACCSVFLFFLNTMFVLTTQYLSQSEPNLTCTNVRLGNPGMSVRTIFHLYDSKKLK